MLQWLTRRPASRGKPGHVYGAVVAAARRPEFYRDLGVPDTPEGRFELIALHLFLVIERIKRYEPDGEKIAQRTLETFVTDMDDCMREMGVGDLTVPKRVKRAAAGFYERAGAYRAGLAQPSDQLLSDAVGRYVLISEHQTPQAEALAVYMRVTAAHIAQIPQDDLVSGRFQLDLVVEPDVRTP